MASGPGDPKKKVIVVKKGNYAPGSKELNDLLSRQAEMKTKYAKEGGTHVRDESNEMSHLGDKRVKVVRKNQVVGGSKKQVRVSKRKVTRSPQAEDAAKRLAY